MIGGYIQPIANSVSRVGKKRGAEAPRFGLVIGASRKPLGAARSSWRLYRGWHRNAPRVARPDTRSIAVPSSVSGASVCGRLASNRLAPDNRAVRCRRAVGSSLHGSHVDCFPVLALASFTDRINIFAVIGLGVGIVQLQER